MDRGRIRAEYRLLEEFANRNPARVRGLRHSADWSEISLDLQEVPYIVQGRRGPERRTTCTLTFRFNDHFPRRPPVFEIGPDRPISSHIWANRTICLLQPAWFPARELWTALPDLFEMIQGGESVAFDGANVTDAAWLRGADNRGRLAELIGERTRFAVVPAGTYAAIVRAPGPAAPAITRAPGPRPS